MSPQSFAPRAWNGTNNTFLFDLGPQEYTEPYDYQGALLFVMGLLCVYGVAIFFLIISLIRKSRTELELVDHLRDFEAMRRASKRRIREQLSQREHSPSPEMFSGPGRAMSMDSSGVRPSMQRRNPGVLRLMRAQKAVDIPEDDIPDLSLPLTSRSILRTQTTTSSSSTTTPPRSPVAAATKGGDVRLVNLSCSELGATCKTPLLSVNNGLTVAEDNSIVCLMDTPVPENTLLLHSRQPSRESYLTPISETAQLNLHEDNEFTSPIYV